MDIKALFDLSYGMYVISTNMNDKKVGCFVNTVTQITAENPIISVSVNKLNYTNDELYIDYNYAVEFNQDSNFNKEEFWKDLYEQCTKFNYRIYEICKFSVADNQYKFSEVVTIEDFYGE